MVPFHRITRSAGEREAVAAVLASGHLAGGGPVTRAAQERLRDLTGAHRVLLTNSGTAALEMALLLLDLAPGDEVILPSFTFSSCANAVALRGATPVFVDVRPDTMNIDEDLIEAAITARTRAIMPVHYAGVGAEMEAIMRTADEHGIPVIEDAAQGIGAAYRARPLGSFGALAAFSFHASKNVSAGEGGALLVNDPSLAERAEILWEKGTNRSRFIRGEVDKYTWVDIGSSFLPGEMTAALLLAQLDELDDITRLRRNAWSRYHAALIELEDEGLLHRPHIPQDRDANGHIYGIFLPTAAGRDDTIALLKEKGVQATFHYVPLHSAPAGLRYGRIAGAMNRTDDLSARLLRLPLYTDITAEEQDHVVESLTECLRGGRRLQ